MSNALPFFEGPGGMPGMTDVLQTVENQLWFWDVTKVHAVSAIISGAARDVGNTNYTTKLRAGLLLGTIAASGKLKEWNPIGTDGSERITHVLAGFMSSQRGGADSDNAYYVLDIAALKPTGLIIPGQSTMGLSGKDFEWLAAQQLLEAGFILEDPKYQQGFSTITAVAATATLTVPQIQARTLVNTGAAGAVIATLPTCKPGLRVRAIATVNQDFTLAAGSGNILGLGANAVLADHGDSIELLGVATDATTFKWMVIAQNGAAFT